MTTTPEQRTKLKAAAEAAAPGPWISYETIVRFDGDMPGGINASHCPRPKETASFIALANPSTILALLAEIEALEARVASAEGALRPFTEASLDMSGTALGFGPGYGAINARAAARAHFQSQGGDHGRD